MSGNDSDRYHDQEGIEHSRRQDNKALVKLGFRFAAPLISTKLVAAGALVAAFAAVGGVVSLRHAFKTDCEVVMNKEQACKTAALAITSDQAMTTWEHMTNAARYMTPKTRDARKQQAIVAALALCTKQFARKDCVWKNPPDVSTSFEF